MSRSIEVEQLLAGWLDAQAPDAAPPDLAGAISVAIATTRRQPGWLVADRWLPWARPGRTVVQVLALAALALLLAATVVLVASSRPRVPPPFGPARPGAFAMSVDGDIKTTMADGSHVATLSSGPAWDSSPTFSRDGTRLAFWSRPSFTDPFDLIVINVDGTDRRSLATTTVSGSLPTTDAPRVSWSPDGHAVAYSATQSDGGSTIVVANVDGSGADRVGDPALSASDPSWSPDGSLLAFRGASGGETGLYVMRPDGTQGRRLQAADVDGTTTVAWAPDGARIGFATCAARCQIHIVGDGGVGDEIVDDAMVAVGPAWSPDGRQIAWYRCANAEDPCEYVVANPDGSNRLGYPQPDAPHHGLDYDRLGPVVQWSPDGSHLTGILSSDTSTADRLVVIDLESHRSMTIEAPELRSWDQQRLAP